MDNNLLKNISAELKETLKTIGRLADSLGISAFVVGGFVRDILLKKGNLDLDIVVQADAIDFAQALAKLISGKLTVYKKFGTATLFSKKFRIDLTTARKETYRHPAALPDVCPGTIKDDLFRRDFTINAMAISLNSSYFGELRDFFEGKKDLKQKRIRILHKLSFVDDPTRILRAIRFKERLDFQIEEGTLYLLKQALKLNLFSKVKPPRILDELVHILKEEKPKRYIVSVNRICGFRFIDPKIRISVSTLKLLKKAEQEITWFKTVFAKKRKLDCWLIYFIILLDRVDMGTIRKIINRFNLSKGDSKRLISSKNISRVIRTLNREILALSLIFKTLEPLSYEVMLLIKIKSSSQRIKRRIIAFLKILNGLKLETRGEDLKSLGLSPGRDFGAFLEKALYKKIDGKLKTKQEELNFIKQIAK